MAAELPVVPSFEGKKIELKDGAYVISYDESVEGTEAIYGYVRPFDRECLVEDIPVSEQISRIVEWYKKYIDKTTTFVGIYVDMDGKSDSVEDLPAFKMMWEALSKEKRKRQLIAIDPNRLSFVTDNKVMRDVSRNKIDTTFTSSGLTVDMENPSSYTVFRLLLAIEEEIQRRLEIRPMVPVTSTQLIIYLFT